MSKRSINTSIWTDPWFEELDVKSKLLFMYLLTNDKTNMLGIYEISMRKISFDTGLSKDDVTKIVDKLTKDKKIVFKENHVVLINFLKNQSYNPNMKKSAINSYNELPTEIKSSSNLLETKDLAKGWLSLYKELGNTYVTVPKIEVEVEVEVEGEIEIENKIPFDDFWNLYDHKVGSKPKAKTKFDKLSLEVQTKIMSTLPNFIKSITEKRFQPHATTYLNNERWQDEITLATKPRFVYDPNDVQ